MRTVTDSYHHGNLRQALVEEAAELARDRGSDGVVLREVARRVGVSHNAAYRHFADREELLAEVAALGMDRLERSMRRRVAAVRTDDPPARALARLRETGRAYVRFAMDEPGLFEVAFSTPLPPSHDDGGPYGVLLAALTELVEVGVLPADRIDGAALSCWSGVHGFAQLFLHGPLRGTTKRQREAMLDQLLDMIETGVGTSR
jgi:AcrR family transcriptional regulator